MIQLLGTTGATATLAGCSLQNTDTGNGNGGNGNGSDGNPTENDDGEDESGPPAQDTDVDTIARHPTDLPDPVDWNEPRHHEIDLHTEELVAEIEDGVTYHFMTFGGRIPGPMIRARRGDRVTLTFDVPEEFNDAVHNVDFHAVYGPGGGAADTTITPGEGPVEIEFRLEYPGAFYYHCAPGQHDIHIGSGMFGTILVEPEDGLREVDREFYLGQHELYTGRPFGEEGHHRFDVESARAENPTYVLFNGEAGRFTPDGEAGPLHAEVGEEVRVFWCNGGPNLMSSPHGIGNVWTRWYDYGDVVSEPARYVEGAALPPGVTGIGEMDMAVPGPIHVVDHALTRVVRKGLLAEIMVEGDEQPDTYNPDPENSSSE